MPELAKVGIAGDQRGLVLDRQGGGETVDVVEFVFGFHVGCVDSSLGCCINQADRGLAHPFAHLDSRGWPVLVALFATEPALSAAEGAGILTSYLHHDSHLLTIRPRSKYIDLQPIERNNRDLIGAVSRCVRPPRRTSKLPQNHFQRSLTT